MEFTFAQVEHALAQAHGIAEGKRRAFQARLQNLQKQGFPRGINTGRGRAARYSVGHVALLGVALELLQLGLTPERAIDVIEDDIHAVAMAISHAVTEVPTEMKFSDPWFLYCDPACLRSLADDAQEDMASATFFYAGLGQVMESFRRWFINGVPRMSFFSVSSMLYRVFSNLQPDGRNLEASYRELSEWASGFVHGEGAACDSYS